MRMQVILSLFSPARDQPLYGAGRKESSGTGLGIYMTGECAVMLVEKSDLFRGIWLSEQFLY